MTADAESASPTDPAQPGAENAAPAATGSPVPTPSPLPRPPKKSAATAAPAPEQGWGRVDEDGTVWVREGEQWRQVGEFPDSTPAEALAYYERKYADLAGEVTLLEARHRRGGTSASGLRQTALQLTERLAEPAAVGDIAALRTRVSALSSTLEEATAEEAQAAREAVDVAIAARTALVEQVEQLAAREPKSVQWKQASARLQELFDAWQTQQRDGPRLPKSTAQALWKRFRDARSTVERHRREFFAELDEAHKGVRDAKTALAERAEELVDRGEDGAAEYRALMDQWKAAGRAGKKTDDALWARFKAAGDAIYGARAERASVQVEESKEKVAARRALLEEARAVADVKDLTAARQKLVGIQRRWDEVGRIFPRETERSLDNEMRKIEQSLHAREDAEWKRNDPEKNARAGDMASQLSAAIEKLEQELAAAEAAGDTRAAAEAAEALQARKAWLAAIDRL